MSTRRVTPVINLDPHDLHQLGNHWPDVSRDTLEKLQSGFVTLDKDNDGYIDIGELQYMLAAMYPEERESIPKVFAAMKHIP